MLAGLYPVGSGDVRFVARECTMLKLFHVLFQQNVLKTWLSSK